MRAKQVMNLGLAIVAIIGLTACSDDDDEGGITNPTPSPSDLAAPTNVQASFDAAAGETTVTWSAVTDATAYDVQRDVVGDGGSFSAVATDLSTTSFVDDDVVEGNTYLYRVIAKDATRTSAPSDPPAELSVGLREVQISGTISGTRNFSADTTYTLVGSVIVEDGGVINIEPGTLILGDSETNANLIVRKGGKLNAIGTPSAPIVFTSELPAGSRGRGDWGGVVLAGRSICNFLSIPGGECVGEGNTGPYGEEPPVLDDDSGHLEYVRIEYAGDEVSFGNEINALTLNAVGSGTTLQFIQTHFGLDDGFEWFGGTVDLKYALATAISDDSFDYSTGWQGRGQFWIAQQDPTDADNGFEVDGNEQDFDATPFTEPTIYNVTLVGGGAGSVSGESTRGLLLRRGTAGKLFNTIVTGFQSSGLDLDNSQTIDRANAGLLEVSNSIFDNPVNFDPDDDGIDEADWAMNQWSANREVDPELADPFNRMAPDFRPVAGGAATTGFATPPNDGFFEDVDFVGGASPTDAPWYEGWTTTDLN